MRENGLKEVSSANEFFTHDSNDAPGRIRTYTLEGKRIIFIEVQALVNENKFSNPKRITQGIDSSRLLILIAIIEKHIGISLINQDVYINVVGGLKVESKEIDLAIIASLLSSYLKKIVCGKIIFSGEVGLSGEIRMINILETIVKEMKMYNYENLVMGYEKNSELRQKFGLKISALKQVKDLKEHFFNL